MSTIFLPALFLNNGKQQRCNRRGGCEYFPNFLGMLRDHPWHDEQEPFFDLWRSGIPIFEDERRKIIRTPRQPWLHRLRIQGYDPEDISVNIDGEKVKVHAKHEEMEGDNVDRFETSRTVKIPPNVNKMQLKSYFLNGGHLVITAPYLETDKGEDSTGNNKKSEEKHGVRAEVREDLNAAEGPKPDIKIEIQYEPTATTGSIGTCEPGIQGTSEISVTTETSEEGVEKEPGQDDREVHKHTPSDNFAADTDAKENRAEADVNLKDDYVITYPPPSPVQSEIHPHFTQSSGEAVETEEKIAAESHPLYLMDSRKITEIDGEKVFQVSMNLKNFKPENISVRLKDNVVAVNAEKELNNDGVFTVHRVHRKFLIPEKGKTENIKAKMNDDGFVEILVPLHAQKLENYVEKEHEKEEST